MTRKSTGNGAERQQVGGQVVKRVGLQDRTHEEGRGV